MRFRAREDLADGAPRSRESSQDSTRHVTFAPTVEEAEEVTETQERTKKKKSLKSSVKGVLSFGKKSSKKKGKNKNSNKMMETESQNDSDVPDTSLADERFMRTRLEMAGAASYVENIDDELVHSSPSESSRRDGEEETAFMRTQREMKENETILESPTQVRKRFDREEMEREMMCLQPLLVRFFSNSASCSSL